VPKVDYKLSVFIENLPSLLGIKSGRVGSFIFRNAYFFVDVPKEPSQDDHLTSLELKVNSLYLRHRKRLPVSAPQYSVKSVVDSAACVAMHNHYCWQYTDEAVKVWKTERSVEPRLALLHHYKRCHMDMWHQADGTCKRLFESVVYDDVMKKYKSELLQRVKKKYQYLNI